MVLPWVKVVAGDQSKASSSAFSKRKKVSTEGQRVIVANNLVKHERVKVHHQRNTLLYYNVSSCNHGNVLTLELVCNAMLLLSLVLVSEYEDGEESDSML